MTLDSGTVLQPELRLGMRRELLDTTANTSAQLTAATSAGSFSAQGVAADRTIGDLGLKLVGHLPNALDLYAAYDLRVSGSQTNQTLGVGARYSF